MPKRAGSPFGNWPRGWALGPKLRAPAAIAAWSGLRWCPLSDKVGQPGDLLGLGDLEPGAEIVPERHGQLGAGLEQAEEGVPGLLARRGAGLAGNFALGDEAADVVLRAVRVRRDLGALEHQEQLVLVGPDPGHGLVELGETGDPAEDPREALLERGATGGVRVVLVELQVGVEPHGVIAQEPAGDAGGGLAVPPLVEPEWWQPPSRGIIPTALIGDRFRPLA